MTETVAPELTGRQRSIAAMRANEKATQFGGTRANPQIQQIESIKTWSVRNALRRFAKLEVSLDDPSTFAKALPKKMSMAEYIAAQGLIRASKLARDFEIVIEQIDGKLASTNINADVSVILGMSDEELIRITSQPFTITDASYSTLGAGEAGEGAPVDAGEDGGIHKTADPASV